MRAQHQIAEFFQGHFSLVCITCLIGGMLFGATPGAVLAPAVPWIMAVLMFSSGLGLRVRDLHSLREKPWLLPVILFLLHLVIPMIWVGLTMLLRFPIEAVMGFAILAILPISASCMVWIGANRANIALGMALLLVDTLFAPFIIPYVLDFLFGANVHIDAIRMLWSLFWMLFFPTLLALVCNRLSHGKLQQVAGKPLALAGKFAILIILFINGGVVSPFFTDCDITFVLVLGMTFGLTSLLFLVSFLLGRLLFTDKEDVISFMLCAIRGTTTGMVIAMAYFPPLTTLTVAFNMLFQQPLGSWAGKKAMAYLEEKEQKAKTAPALGAGTVTPPLA